MVKVYNLASGMKCLIFIGFQFGLSNYKCLGKISLCIHLLFSRNNSGNNGWPLGAAPFVFRSLKFFFFLFFFS